MTRHSGWTVSPDLNSLADDGLSTLAGIAGAAAPDAFAPPVHDRDFGHTTETAAPAAASTQPAPTQLVFIEANVPDLQDLLNGLAPGAQAVLLNPDQEGVQQIAAYLASHNVSNLAGIDLVAHGADGEVALGTATLSTASLPTYQTQLAQIGAALAPGGAIQIYGCDVGEDAAGVAFLDQLSAATGGANIAAASHLVGDAAGGGSFDLNVNVGTVDVGTPFTSAALTSFKGELSLSTSPQLYFSTNDGNQVDSSTEFAVAGIAANGTAASGAPSTLAAAGGANSYFSFEGIALDAPLDRYFVGASGNANNGSGILLEGTITSGGAYLTNATPAIISDKGDSGSLIVGGLAFNPANNEVLFAQQGRIVNFSSSTASVITSGAFETGIWEFGANATPGAITPTLVVNAISNGHTLQGPTGLAVIPGTNIVIFGDSDSYSAWNGGKNSIDYGNVLGHQWGTLYTFSGSALDGVDGKGSNGAYLPSVAVDATSATGGTLFWTGFNAEGASGDLTQNYIIEASYTITGSGTAQAAAISNIETLYAGTAADYPTDIVLNPAAGLFYITDFNGGVFAGNMTYTSTNATPLVQVKNGASSLTPGSAQAEDLFLETLPTLTAAGTVTYNSGTAVAVDPSVTLLNTDGQAIYQAFVAITDFNTGDTLTAGSLAGGITQTFNTATGILTLTGTAASQANWTAALASITYTTTSGVTTARVIGWSANDGLVAGPTLTSDVTVASTGPTLVHQRDGDVQRRRRGGGP